MIDPLTYPPKGDKKNSDYFNEYRIKIYERRQTSGLNDLIGNMKAIIVQVQTGDAFLYLQELYAMMPYRYYKSFLSDTHRIYILKNTKKSPLFIVMEPLDPNFEDDLARINCMYPNAREKCNARYVGEIFHCKDLAATKNILESHDFRFQDPNRIKNHFFSNPYLAFTRMSDHTFNSIGYSHHDLFDIEYFNLGQPFSLTQKQLDILNVIDDFSKESGIKPLMKGIDHLATRILAGEREDAILEFLCLSNYYFWGAYNIGDMNSSTNVNRAPHGHDIQSPAKVFTANNTPFMINSFEKLPMPTENFVRNYGRRMHHIAIEIADGDHSSTMKNLDFVIGVLKNKMSIGFLANVFGECKDEPDLKQIFSKHSSLSILITEYVERCHKFDGFFTKQNVAALTEAAGLDEEVKQHHLQKGIVGD
ncbi:MAG: hypothetical protein P1U61_05870 [Legionellaceae bacterium]|nr:hypothetical protein [Legionellaceae bacterium]